MKRFIPFLLLSCVAQSQIIVDPNGSGNFPDLQLALHLAPPGSTIMVNGGVYYGVTIHKDVKIIGNPTFTVETNDPYSSGFSEWRPPIEILNNVSITIEGLISRSVRTSLAVGQANAAIKSYHSGYIRLYNCDISGVQLTDWSNNGFVMGYPGIDAPLMNIDVYNSIIRGSNAHSDGFDIMGFDGPDAIVADMVTIDTMSSATGGNGGEYYARYTTPDPNLAGSGGNGIVANRIIDFGASLSGGNGGLVYNFNTNTLLMGNYGSPYLSNDYYLETAPSLINLTVPHVNGTVSLSGDGACSNWFVLGLRSNLMQYANTYGFMNTRTMTVFYGSTINIPNWPTLFSQEFAVNGFDCNGRISSSLVFIIKK